MNTATTPVRIDTAHGPLHVAVAPAVRSTSYVEGTGNVTELRPRLRVATDPTFEADPNHADHWTIRGRAYAVHLVIVFRDLTHLTYVSGYRGERWHKDDHTPYRGGFRNDKRKQVEFRTPTWDLMWATMTTALEAFNTDHDGWMDLSRFLLMTADAEAEINEAEEARRTADKHDEKARAFAAEAQLYSAAVPDGVFALYAEKRNG